VRIAVAVTVLLVVPVVGAAAVVITTDRYVLTLDDVEGEDVYVASSSGVGDGTVEGDLVIATADLSISGTVTGDVLVLSRGRVTISGTVDGSVRGVARSVGVSGRIADDLAVAALSVSVTGSVGRDVLALGGAVDIDGEVGRDVLGRAYDVRVAGSIGNDLDMGVRGLEIASGADIGGDALYRSGREAAIADDAVVAGQVIRLPARAGFFVTVVLQAAFLLGFLGYLVGGVALLWLFARTSTLAVAVAGREPLQALGIGAAALVGVPVAVAVLTATLVGIPLALVTLTVFLGVLLFGTVPFLAAAGMRFLRGRGGVYGGFVVAAVAWGLVAALLPALGVILFIVALVWGTGSWLLGGWRSRVGVPVETVASDPGTP
jgi:hypothetical protein